MIEELALRGFKSYPVTRSERVRFTRGVNKISGRNAAGKTTLLEAVLFGLYGDVPGVSKQSLVPLGGNDLNVTVTLRSPLTDQMVRIHREGGLTKDGGFRTTKSHMTVEGEDHPYTREREVQTRLRELLGIGRNTLLNIVYARQKDFIEVLNPQRNRMDAILGLTAPAEIREQFREVRRMLETRGRIGEKGAIEERIRNTESILTQGEEQLGEIRARKAELEKGLGEMRASLREARGRVEDLEIFLVEFSKLDGLQTEVEKLELISEERKRDLESVHESLGASPDEALAELRASMEGARSTEERLQRLVDEELGAERRQVAGEVSRLEHQINEHAEFKEQGLTLCPKCGQEIDYALIEEDLTRWEKELTTGRGRLKALDSEIDTIQSQVRVARDKWIRADKEIDQIEGLMNRSKELRRTIEGIVTRGREMAARLETEAEGLLEKAEADLGKIFASPGDAKGKLEEELRGARYGMMELREEVRSREVLIEEEEKREKDLESRLEEHGRTLEEARGVLSGIHEYEAKIRAVEAVQRRYGEYEKQLRENTLALLEYQTYNYFKRLTDQQIYGACEINRENYALEVYPIGDKGKIPAWRAGGGHESLLALAERLALLRVMGFPHLLILDEPTDAVDSENVPQLLEYVARSGRELGQVLLVTHHGHGEEEGVNLITVRKVGGESRVYQELGVEP
ncbi:MAG: AAA family ATPase [Candidatus Bathyarchaeota archaeon]|nr:MAG: AAA family ATPase [Candidatus Bathyarchaeota archaeon]